MNNSRTYGYVRVSSKGQNEERQIKSLLDNGVEERFIFLDKESGKDFNRIQYQILKRALRENDVLIVKSIDRLGRNYDMILAEWKDITKNIKAHIKVIDMPILDTTNVDGLLRNVINDIILALLSFVAEEERAFIRQRQREGIDLALKNGTKTGRNIGRPRIEKPSNFNEVVLLWKNKEIKTKDAMEMLKLRPNTFYNFVKEEV